MSVPIKLEIEIKEEFNDNVNTILDLYREIFTVSTACLNVSLFFFYLYDFK